MWQDLTMKTFPQFKQNMEKKKLTLVHNLFNLLINFFLNHTANHNMYPKLPRLV